MTTVRFDKGGYRYIPAVPQYSAGVAAEPGFRIERVQLQRPVPLQAGFELIKQHLQTIGRPLAAFCACEVRSPKPVDQTGFREFNEAYSKTLVEWGIMEDGVNPVTRSNLCLAVSPLQVHSLHAFSYTVPADAADTFSGFVVAGAGETVDGKGSYLDHLVARGDTSVDGLRQKMTFVIREMERRMALLGYDWSAVTATQIYTVHDIHPLLEELIGPLNILSQGLAWHYNLPPLLELEYEMDCRAVSVEYTLPVQNS